MLDIEKKYPLLTESFVKKHLELLEEKVDLKHVQSVEQKQLDTFQFKEMERLPVLVSTRDDVAHKTAGGIDWPEIQYEQLWHDYNAMLLNELRPAYESVILKDDKVFSVRPNLSQVVIPSIFDVNGIFYGDHIDAMPAVHGALDENILEKSFDEEINFSEHWSITRYLEIVENWKNILSDFPNLKKAVRFALPDLQGPFNLYFLLRGTDAYTDLILKPEFTHRIMKKITDLLADISIYLGKKLGYDGVGYHWNYAFPGMIRNVDDNSVQISPQHYSEFVLPYNILLAEKCNGGIHHYCGQGDHILEKVLKIPGVFGLNFGNPELQDWDLVYEKAMQNKVVLLFDKAIEPELFKTLRKGVIMKIIVSSLEEGKKEMESYT